MQSVLFNSPSLCILSMWEAFLQKAKIAAIRIRLFFFYFPRTRDSATLRESFLSYLILLHTIVPKIVCISQFSMFFT